MIQCVLHSDYHSPYDTCKDFKEKGELKEVKKTLKTPKVKSTNKINIMSLRRCLGCTYKEAAQIIEVLEELGIVKKIE